MKNLFRYWYIILITALLSLGAAIGLLYLRQDSWMPPTTDPLAAMKEASPIASMSEEYVRWNFEAINLEELREDLEGQRSIIESERIELEALREQVNLEVAEMNDLRAEIDEVRRSVDEEFLKIDVSEEANLKSLAKIYGAMKPVPVVEIFKELETELVVKIMSVMPAETAGGILEQMTREQGDPQVLARAAQITEKLRKIRK